MVKKTIKQIVAEWKRQREIARKLENLTDHGFLDRALGKQDS